MYESLIGWVGDNVKILCDELNKRVVVSHINFIALSDVRARRPIKIRFFLLLSLVNRGGFKKNSSEKRRPI